MIDQHTMNLISQAREQARADERSRLANLAPEEALEQIAREIGQHSENCAWDVCSESEQDAARRSAKFILAKVWPIAEAKIEAGAGEGATRNH